jgi:hypothetical protein
MEALHAQTKHLIGEVVLYRPLSFAWLTLVSLVFAAAIIAFLALASYTRKEEKMVSDPNLLQGSLQNLDTSHVVSAQSTLVVRARRRD